MGKRLAAVLAVVLALLPGVALASATEYVTWSGDTGDGLAYAVRATNRYNAALLALGYEPSEVAAAYREKLSDANYGGKFYTYAQTFTQPNGIDSLPGWYPVYALINVIAYGTSDLWCSKVSAYDYGQAKADLVKVLNGESGGGGSGEIEVPSGYTLLDGGYASSTLTNYVVAPVASQNMPVRAINPTRILSSWSNINNIGMVGLQYMSGNTPESLESRWFNLPDGVYLLAAPQNAGSKTYNIYLYNSNANSVNVPMVHQRSRNQFSSMVVIDGVYQLSADNNTATINVNANGYYNIMSVASWQYCLVVAANYNKQPSGDWPENPTPTPTPDPPELPSPTEPEPEPEPEPDPITADPYVPTLPPLTYPTVTTEPTGTTPADYTPWLRQILAALNSIHTDLATYTNDIVSGLNQVISAINALAQSNVDAANKLDASLDTHCEHLRTNLDNNFYGLKLYLKQLFEWLRDQIRWYAAGYDDTALLRELKVIESKLGGGSYRPNPSNNPAGGSPDFFEWLQNLLAGWLNTLFEGLPDIVKTLLSDIGDLTSYFPISAPWDLGVILALFAHEPVTPVFDIPLDMLPNEEAINIHVDLSPYDSIMATVRAIETIVFVGGLIKMSFDRWKPDDFVGSES